MSSESFGVAFETVLEKERKCIEERRKAAGVVGSPVHPGGNGADHSNGQSGRANDGLIGLALSGGGIRSAVYNLGFLQALSHGGLLKYVDYLCSVSGGGYIAAHLTTLADLARKETLQANAQKNPQEKVRPENQNFYEWTTAERRKQLHMPQNGSAASGRERLVADLGITEDEQLTSEYRFRHVGEYLSREPFHFFWRYAFCTALMLGVVAGGIGSAATVAALLWRSLDLHAMREFLRIAGVNDLGVEWWIGDETPIAFMPCLAPLIALVAFGTLRTILEIRPICRILVDWLGARPEGLQRWRHQVGVAARLSAMALLVFVGISTAVLLGNGESMFGAQSDLIPVQQYFTWFLVAITGISLLPLLRFKSVIQSARETSPAWKRVVGRVLVGGICCLTPFLFVHLMARENISRFATHRDPDLLVDDILDWPVFLAWYDGQVRALNAKPATEFVAANGKKAATALDPAGRLMEPAKQIYDKYMTFCKNEDQILAEEDWPRYEQVNPGRLRGAYRRLALVGEYFVKPGNASALGMHLEEFKNLRAAQQRAILDNINKPHSFLDERKGSDLSKEDATKGSNSLEAPKLYSAKFTVSLVRELLFQVGRDADDEPGNKSAEQGGAKQYPVEQDQANPTTIKRAESTAKWLEQRKQELKPLDRSQFEEDWKQVTALSGLEPNRIGEQVSTWRNIERGRFNRTLLEIVYPGMIRSRTMVSTSIVPEQDQAARLRWLAIWMSVLVVCVLLNNVNATSPFFIFYRQRLFRHFLHSADPTIGEQHRQRLSGLAPWKTGAPYPLFLTSMFLFERETPPSQHQEYCKAIPPAGERLFESSSDNSHPLVLSPLYVGSKCLQFAETKHYCEDDLSVADAVALSGAAVTPFMSPGIAIKSLMAAVNLRIGQWLPRPDRPSTAWSRWVLPYHAIFEFVRSLGLSWPKALCRENWKYGLVADGGFHEFFGLEELLLRGCELIVVSDAGCNNGKFELGALADALRLIRCRHGIRFGELGMGNDEKPTSQSLSKEYFRDLVRPQEELLDGSVIREPQVRHYTIFKAYYPKEMSDAIGPQECTIIYCQMSLTGDEPLDLEQFHNTNPDFPDEPTTNQFYDEDQVESFRQLGFHVGSSVIGLDLGKSNFQASDHSTEAVSELLIERHRKSLRSPGEHKGSLRRSMRAEKKSANRR